MRLTEPLPRQIDVTENYSMKKNSIRSIAQIGEYPPYGGGHSVHIQRLHSRLIASGIFSQVYCQPLQPEEQDSNIFPVPKRLTWKRWLVTYGWRCKAEIIHCHNGWHWSPAMVIMALFGKKIVMTLHDQRMNEHWAKISPFERFFSRLLVKLPNVAWVAVSSVIKKQLIDFGVHQERISVIPAFIPPSAQGELPSDLQLFCKSHAPLLSTYAFKIPLDAHREDVYGLDLCINMVNNLIKNYPQIGLVICAPGDATQNYINQLLAQSKYQNIRKNVFSVSTYLENAHLIWGASDLFIRATNTDGDAITIREALNSGTPVVASDVCPRPAGVNCFKNRDANDLNTVVKSVLSNKQNPQKISISDNYSALIEIYNHLLSQ